jgi:hypothetical protein
MIVNNIEELTSPIPCWKFIKTKTPACSFLELTERIEPVLYNSNKLNSVFPYNCNALPLTGDFAVVLLAEDMDQIFYLGVCRTQATRFLNFQGAELKI